MMPLRETWHAEQGTHLRSHCLMCLICLPMPAFVLPEHHLDHEAAGDFPAQPFLMQSVQQDWMTVVGKPPNSSLAGEWMLPWKPQVGILLSVEVHAPWKRLARIGHT